MQAQDVQNAIVANDNMKIRSSTVTHKDTLTARGFIMRLEQGAKIGNWNDARRCAEFCHLMHSKANRFMMMTFKKAKIAENYWAGHKTVFLKFYDIKGTAKLNFFSLHEMKQGPTEQVRDFWNKVKCHKDLIDVQEQIETLEEQDFPAANVADIQKECRRTAGAMQDFYKKMIFIAGLNADVRVKVMEAMPKFAYDALMIPWTQKR